MEDPQTIGAAPLANTAENMGNRLMTDEHFLIKTEVRMENRRKK